MSGRPTLQSAQRAAMTALSWLLVMLWVIRPPLARGLQHAGWALQSPIATPYATFTADSTTLIEGTCTWLRWNVGNAQSVLVEGQPKPLSGAMQVCPAVSTMYRLQLFTAEGEQERLLRITVIPRTPVPTFTPTSTPAPFPTFTPTRTPTAPPSQVPSSIWTPTPPNLTPPSDQFPPPSLTEPVVSAPTTPAMEQPTPPPATVEPPAPLPTPMAEARAEERIAPEQPQRPARRTPPPPIEGTRQDAMRLLVFGLVGVASAAVLGLISLILWWRRW